MNIAVLGDSISAHCRPIAYWDQYVVASSYNFAVPGATTGDILTKQLPGALATDASVVVLFGGTNDMVAPYPLAQAEANLDNIVNQCAAAGKAVVMVCPLPRCGSGDDANLKTALLALGSWMKAASGRVVDPYPYFDNGSGCMNAALNYQTDGQHPNEDGELLLAGLIGSVLPRTVVSVAPLQSHTGPVLSASVANGQVTATWSGVQNPMPQDWVGLFAPGAASGAYVTWSWVNGAQPSTGTNYTTGFASGSITYPAPTPGTYEARLFANNTTTLIATSASFTV